MKEHNFAAKSGVFVKSIQRVSSGLAAGCDLGQHSGATVVSDDEATGSFSLFWLNCVVGLSLDCLCLVGCLVCNKLAACLGSTFSPR